MESAAVRFVRRYFAFEHLPDRLQDISRPFCKAARDLVAGAWLDEDEAMAGLRKLLEAKDCFVRAALQERD